MGLDYSLGYKRQAVKLIILSCCITLLNACATAKQPPQSDNQKLVSLFSEGGLVSKEIKRGVVVYIPSVFFSSGSANMEESALGKLEYIARIANKAFAAKRKIELEGHTDSKGNDDYNMNLSKERAENVYDYLLKNKVIVDRMSVDWFGETRPLVPNEFSDGRDNPEGRSANRRVEIILLNEA